MARYNASFTVVTEFEAVDDAAAEKLIEDLRALATSWPDEVGVDLDFVRTTDLFFVRAEKPEIDPRT